MTEKDTEAKTVRQLKETIKSLKKENEVLKEHSATEIKLTREKRYGSCTGTFPLIFLISL
jgi:hypothetical protein